MPDYRLEGLSSRSFEQLTQALAHKHLGARCLIFGDGPDGGREAEYRGRCKLPPGNEEWDGHVIIQAKFLQSPADQPKANTDWLLSQLDKEMKKFSPRRSKALGITPPDYYVLSTNIRNSGVAEKGGKDRLSGALNSYAKKFHWKGWALWDGSELARMLDGALEIRSAYAAWITPGDVLTEMLRSIAESSPDFRQTMLARLQEDFRGAQYAKLRQAGHGNEEKTPLSRLFVDLPITDIQAHDPPEENPEKTIEAKPSSRLETFLNVLLRIGDLRLTPESIEEAYFQRAELLRTQSQELELSTNVDRLMSAAQDAGKLNHTTNKIVLLGGPGQGKTTVGQFACQLYREALLRESRQVLQPETRDALNTFAQQCDAALRRPIARRYPIWIDLKELAKWLAEVPGDPPPILLAFLARRLGSVVEVSDLKRWLKLYPWFVVFDGLDEVPASSGRENVIRCIDSFLTEAHTLGADILVLCTTRPQGYTKEFDQRYFRHVWLAPLSPIRALAYGEKLLDVRHSRTGDDRRTFGDRLKQAAENDTTARVMRSPLQVTIMTALIERVGRPPEQRWKLFQEYYSVIYERERERGTAWSDILARYDSEVTAVHRAIGWRLQLRSERAKDSGARITATEFIAELRGELTKLGHKGKDLEWLVASLGNAATERLVFLVALGSDEIGFEIRSLQEFMAGDHLFKDGDQETCARLSHIAKSTYWRNVFLFAAGRILASQRYLTHNLQGILSELNEDPVLVSARLSLAGSSLAIDILEDGSPNHIPSTRDVLVRIACRILDVSIPNEHRRLALVSLQSGSDVLKEEVEKRLSGPVGEGWFGAFTAVLSLWEKSDWARLVCEKHFPKGTAEQHKLLTSSSEWYGRSPFLFLFSRLFRESSPYTPPYFYFDNSYLDKLGVGPELLKVARLAFFGNRLADVTVNGNKTAFAFLIHPISKLAEVPVLSMPPKTDGMHKEWGILWAEGCFLGDPNPRTLAEMLDFIAQGDNWPVRREVSERLAWPIQFALSLCESASDLVSLSKIVTNGGLGDVALWKTIESVLLSDGIDLEELRRSWGTEATHQKQHQDRQSWKMDVPCVCAAILKSCVIVGPRVQSGHELSERVMTILFELCPSTACHLIASSAWSEDAVWYGPKMLLEISRKCADRIPVSQAMLERLALCDEAFSGDMLAEICSVIGWVRLTGGLTENSAPAVINVLHKMTADPFNRGCWRMLSLLAPLPTAEVYRALATTQLARSALSGADLVAFRIAARDWTDGDANMFAQEIVEALKVRQDLIERVVMLLEFCEADDAKEVVLVKALLDGLPPDELRWRQSIRKGLRRLHIKRPSGYHEESALGT